MMSRPKQHTVVRCTDNSKQTLIKPHASVTLSGALGKISFLTHHTSYVSISTDDNRYVYRPGVP